VAGLGGTFDHLHEGHHLLLTTALKVANRVLIGLATDSLLQSKADAEYLQSYDERMQGILDFVATFADPERVSFVPLDDPFGPAVTSAEMEVLVMSAETLPNAEKINEMREERGLPPVILVVIPIIKSADGSKLSSTDFRAKLAGETRDSTTD
jgi:pantetheine-phosphate adenylyltransferase